MAANIQDAILLFGDSITQGSWQPDGLGQRLAYVYARKLDVINRGFSGYNTKWALPVFEKCFANKHEQQHVPKVRILAIWFGTNDAAIKPSPQHVPLPDYIANLEHMVHAVESKASPQYSTSTKIILITPPPINTHQWGANLAARNPPVALERNFEVTKSYAQAVTDLAAREGVALVDAWTHLWEAAGRDEHALSRFMVDGLHLNSSGYAVVYDAFMHVITEKFPDLHHDKLNMVFPPWTDMI